MGGLADEYAEAVILDGYSEKAQKLLCYFHHRIALGTGFLACLQGIPKYKKGEKQRQSAEKSGIYFAFLIHF